MSVISKLLPAIFAALIMASSSLFAQATDVVVDEVTTALQKEILSEITKEINKGSRLEDAITLVSGKYGSELTNNPEVTATAIFGAIVSYAKANGIATDSAVYFFAIDSATSSMKNLGVSVSIITMAAVSSNVKNTVIVASLPSSTEGFEQVVDVAEVAEEPRKPRTTLNITANVFDSSSDSESVSN
jgi:hypothetical protein